MRFRDMEQAGPAMVRQYWVTRLLVRGGDMRVPPPKNLKLNWIRCTCNMRGWHHYKFGSYHDDMIKRILGR